MIRKDVERGNGATGGPLPDVARGNLHIVSPQAEKVALYRAPDAGTAAILGRGRTVEYHFERLFGAPPILRRQALQAGCVAAGKAAGGGTAWARH